MRRDYPFPPPALLSETLLETPRVTSREPLWSKDYCDGAWLLSRYDDVAAALRDPRFSARRATRWINRGLALGEAGPGLAPDAALLRFKRIFARSLLFLDGRPHRRLRGILQDAFRPSDLASHAAAMTTLAEQLIKDLASVRPEHPECDFIAGVARPLPALVIARLMGLPTPAPQQFIDWAVDLAAFIGSPTPDPALTLRAQHALAALCDYLEPILARSLPAPAHTLLGRLWLARQERRVSDHEMLAQCATLLLAGYETTRNLLGNGLLALLRHPSQWAALKASPARLRPAIREMLRYDSPVQYTGRRLLADIELGGCRLRKGDLAILHIGAANHDPRRFSDPERFDIGRDEGNHLSFGHGPHVCLGAALTQLEAEIVFTALIRIRPDLSLTTETPRWQKLAAYRALEKLPVRLGSPCHA